MSLVFVPLWTSGYVVGKLATDHVDVLTVLVWRFVIASVLMWGLTLVVRPPMPRGREWLHLGVVGFLLQIGQFGGIYSGLAGGVSAGLTSLLAGLAPLLVGLLAPLVSDERIGLPQVVGLALGASGVVIVIGADVEGAVPWGALSLTVVGVLSLVAGTLYQRRLAAHPTALIPTIAAQNTLSLVLCTPVLLLTDTMVAPAGTEGWLTTTYLGLFPSCLGFALFYTLLQRRGTTYVSSLLNLVPAVTALVSVPVLGEDLTPRIVLGLVVAIVGLYVGVVWHARREARAADVREREPAAT
jgi:drug/metabolite transporter (DMT)-like permease